MGHGAGIMFGTVCSLSTLVSQYVCRGIRLRVTADALSGNGWERFAHGAHRLGQLHSFHPPIGPSQKGTTAQHWDPENSKEMGIT